MEPSEYANLDAVEQTHWYYAGKRELVEWWLLEAGKPEAQHVLLDCGAGTGRFALQVQRHCRVLVLDDHDESLKLLHSRFEREQVLELQPSGIPLANASLDFVTALDVLEHVEDDRAAVKEFSRLLKPGGVALITVPASMSLWSDWDVALHHFRRYDRRSLRALFPSETWELLHLNYTNVLVFPAVWFIRKWRKWSRPAASGTGARQRAEDRVPPRWINRLLQRLFVGAGKMRLRFPFGVSLLLVARRR